MEKESRFWGVMRTAADIRITELIGWLGIAGWIAKQFYSAEGEKMMSAFDITGWIIFAICSTYLLVSNLVLIKWKNEEIKKREELEDGIRALLELDSVKSIFSVTNQWSKNLSVIYSLWKERYE